MKTTRDFIDIMAKPVIVVSCDGTVIHINKHGHLLLNKTANKDNIEKIYEIDPDFDFAVYENQNSVKKTIYIKKLKLYIDIFNSEFENNQNVLLYIFDHVLFNSEIVNIFNHIGDIIDITDADGIIEAINDAVYTITGCSRDVIGVGSSIRDLYNDLIVTEPAFFSVIKEKKPIIKRVRYSSGVTLLNRGYPIFSQNGEIERTVIFGQNISDLSSMDERLILSEQNKNENIMKIDEITEYFNKNHIIFSSDIMKKIVNTAIKIAPSESSVFIWGESGVGKELIAKIIHNSSSRKDKPFVAINCAAIPNELFESELFGYEQGAFSGAHRFGKKGLMEEANGGTLFLDEVGEMPYSMQSKLLRALQENKIRRVGAIKDIEIDIRYISATNLNIEQILNNEQFRRDLYYRLGVVPINIPPLRTRREDILSLIRYFMEYYDQQLGKSVSLSKNALRKLISYDWPGNVRELKNTLERMIVMAESNIIEDIDLYENYNPMLLNESMNQDIIVKNIVPIKKAYTILENALVKKAFKETGSIVKTAQMLGINPSTIHRKIKNGELSI